MALTDEQLLERRSYIGGSDAPQLAGLSPWGGPMAVYLEKHGLAEPRATSDAMELGNLLEDDGLELLRRATGIAFRRRLRPVRRRGMPWAGGHLDGDAPEGIAEVKWALSSRGWGEPWTADIPPHYYCQVQHYLALTDRPQAYVGAVLGYGEFRPYVIPRDEPYIADLMELEEDWWARHGPPHGLPPEPDGSEEYGRHLRQQLRQSAGDERVATPEEAALARQLREVRERLAGVQRQEAELVQQLQLSMGTTGRLVGDGWGVSWPTNKPKLTVRWEDLATDLLRISAEEESRDWPKTKKAQAELVREVAQRLGHAERAEEGARGAFRVTYDDEPTATEDTTSA